MMTRALYNLPNWNLRSPFDQLDFLKKEIDSLSGAFLRGTPFGALPGAGVFPMINLTENANVYYVRAELPGLKSEDLDIQVNGKNLTIAGERKIPSEGDSAKYHRSEREAGKFSRVIALPGEIDAGKVKAKLLNGLLTVIIPKAEEAKPKKISVR